MTMNQNKTLFTYSFRAATAASAVVLAGAATTAHAQETTSTSVGVADQPAGHFTPVEGLGFATPWLLAGALALPVLWFLMRLTPPQPMTMRFPGTRILRGLQPKEETPDSLPFWHKMLRLSAAALAVAALSGPLLNPDAKIGGDGPVMLVVDNDWAAARNWDMRRSEMNALIDAAEKDGRGVMILTTAAGEDGQPVRLTPVLNAADARQAVGSLAPVPWETDRAAAYDALTANDNVPANTSVVWLSNGIDGEGSAAFAQALRGYGSLTVRADMAEDAPRLLIPPQLNEGALTVTVLRADGSAPDIVGVIASDSAARPVDRQEVRFAAGQTEVQVTFDLPDEILRSLARVDIEGEKTAAATVLLDGQWRHRPVGVISTGPAAAMQTLGNEYGYINAALAPYAAMSGGNVQELLSRDLAVMVMPDAAVLDADNAARVSEWVNNGGTLLRFAGPNLAVSPPDDLLPVELRNGGSARNTAEGSTQWGAPARIAPFDRTSPFYGLTLPPDLVIERQVVAQPGSDIAERTWAKLEDGTPLVTFERRGQGLVVLMHTAANTNWSNLVMSGLFSDMLRAIVNESAGVRGNPDAQGALPSWKTLDAQGRLQDAGPHVRGLTQDAVRAGMIGPELPPGIYGTESGRRAYNLGAAVSSVAPLSASLPQGVQAENYVARGQNDLTGPLLGGALALLLADMVVVLAGRRFRALRSGGPAPQP